MSKFIKKKLIGLIVVGVLAIPMVSFANITPTPISASESINKNDIIGENEEKQNEYIRQVGIISNIDEVNGQIRIKVDLEGDEYGIVYHIPDSVLLLNRDTEKMIEADSLKEGMNIESYCHKNTPVALSLPPQLTPGVIVVQGEEYKGSTYLGEFNEALISSDNFLKLNITEDTLLVNKKGEKIEVESIHDQAVLVFYGAATKSIPAQTIPSKVILLEDEKDKEELKETVALRDIANELAYKIEWDNKEKTATLTKQNQTIVIKIGSADYSLNKSLGKFSRASELSDGKMYVSAEILELMK